jgi:hypothetical protein
MNSIFAYCKAFSKQKKHDTFNYYIHRLTPGRNIVMPMSAKQKIERIKPEDELCNCPGCGYTDGFHVSFQEDAASGHWEIVLICPQCHRKYRMGWKISLS